MRDRELVERVKDATDLVALVSQAVKLRKQGSSYSGLCPFHSERSPSFQVVAQRGFYHCFGCGKHGDVFTWLMERDGMTFREALEQLAGAAGIELPTVRERPAAEVDLETRMRAVLESAQAWFQHQLGTHAQAREYLQKRGITPEFEVEGGFGVAPNAWEGLVTHLKGLGYSPELIEQAGLASRSERGSMVDFLRDRLTIPIHDARGRLVAFGGRTFGDGQPKYLNTRETALFRKGESLFGMHRAKGVMRDGALVVEGYFDVLTLQQVGIPQVVAPLGTALTEAHLQQLKHFTPKLILCFDGDAAGIRAMDKSLRLALPLGFDVRLLELPAGEDPDTWCLKLGPEAFRELLRMVPDWTSFVLNRALAGKDLRRVQDRMAALKDLLEFLPYLPSGPERREFFASLAHQLQLPPQELERAVRQRGRTSGSEPAPVPSEALVVDELLRPLVRLCATPEGRSLLGTLPPTWWENLPGAQVLQCLLDAEGDEASLPEEILATVRGLEARALARDSEGSSTPEVLFAKLELAYVHRELGDAGRMLQDPRVLADPEVTKRVEERAEHLRGRKSSLARQLRKH
jgi:DNA primase